MAARCSANYTNVSERHLFNSSDSWFKYNFSKDIRMVSGCTLQPILKNSKRKG